MPETKGGVRLVRVWTAFEQLVRSEQAAESENVVLLILEDLYDTAFLDGQESPREPV